jgi:hypothetical protein
MTRFILSILAVTVFFIGLGSLVEKTGAAFKSDENALALIAKARQAIGGDAAINSVQSLRIVGRTSRNVKINGVDEPQVSDTEIAMAFPDKVVKMVKIGKDDGSESGQIFDRQIDVVTAGEPGEGMKIRIDADADPNSPHIQKKIMIKKDDGTVQELTGADADKWIAEHPGVPGERKIVIKHGDGDGEEITGPNGEKMLLRHGGGDEDATFTTKDGKTVTLNRENFARHPREGHMKHNDMLRFALSLLLTAPKGTDVVYTSGGEGSVDGISCNIVVASVDGQAYKLFLDASSNLPVAMNFTGTRMPQLMTFEHPVAAPAEGGKETVFFRQRMEPETAEFQVRFSDYRSVNGVQLPYRWVQTVGGADDETFDVTTYEINTANIAEKFVEPKGMIRMRKKTDGQ